MMKICDCERSHNGLGMVGRECDCPSNPKELAAFALCMVGDRVAFRIDAMNERGIWRGPHPRLKALYANPNFWRGCAAARDDNITVASYIRIIEKLETGTEVTEIPEFDQWLARRTTTVNINTNTSPKGA